MQDFPRSLALAVLLIPLAGCGEGAGQAAGGVYARMLAETTARECLKGKDSAPTAAYADHVQKLCDCTRDKIIAAAPGPTEADSDRRDKMQGALNSCIAEIGATPAG